MIAALEEMERDGVNQLPVMVDDQIQGMLGREKEAHNSSEQCIRDLRNLLKRKGILP